MRALLLWTILLMSPMQGSAASISVALDEFLGTYVLGEAGGGEVEFDLGVVFSEIQGASITIRGFGTPGLIQDCPFLETCNTFESLARASFWIEKEIGPGFLAFLGGFNFTEDERTRTRVLTGDPEDFDVFLDGIGKIVFISSGFATTGTLEIIIPWEFTVTELVLIVEGTVVPEPPPLPLLTLIGIAWAIRRAVL